MFYSAHIKNNSGTVVESIVSSDKDRVIEWMSEQKKVRKMRDKRPVLFRRTYAPVFRNRQYFTLTCNFLILKRKQ